MPQKTIQYKSKEEIPAELAEYAGDDFKVTVWVGDKVAEETNATLAKNRDDILAEKNTFETKYKALVETSAKGDVAMATKVAELELKLKNNQTITPEDQKLLDAVKGVKGVQVTPEYLAEAAKNYKPVSEKLANIERTQSDAEFFKATGFKNEKAFHKAMADKEANPKLIKHYTEKKTENGQEVVTTYAEVRADDGTTVKVKFDEYFDKHADWSVYKPSLMAAEQQQQTWMPASQSQQSQQFSQPSYGQPGFGQPGFGQQPTGTNPFLEAAQKGFDKINDNAQKQQQGQKQE